MRLRATLAFLLVLAGVQADGLAQQSIPWGRDARQAVEQAKAADRPIMFYIVSREGDRPDEIETSQKQAFRDARVIELSKRFVCSQLQRSRYPDLLEKWNLPPRINLEILFVTPEGEPIGGTLSPSGVANADSLAQKMVMAFNEFRRQVFEKKLRKPLEDENTAPKDIQAALAKVSELLILSADATVLRLAQRENLDAKTRDKALDVLADLSTPAAVEALFKLALEDAKVEKALARCTPEAAETLLKHLGSAEAREHAVAYAAIVKVCKISDGKPARFWEGKNETIKKNEIERVKKIAETKAARWKETYGKYR